MKVVTKETIVCTTTYITSDGLEFKDRIEAASHESFLTYSSVPHFSLSSLDIEFYYVKSKEEEEAVEKHCSAYCENIARTYPTIFALSPADYDMHEVSLDQITRLAEFCRTGRNPDV